MAIFKSVPFRPFDLPDKYDPDYKLFLDREPVEFKLLPPLATHLESFKSAYGSNTVPYRGIALDAPALYFEVRRINKRQFGVCRVKTPGGIILRCLSRHKTRQEADAAFYPFKHPKEIL